MTNIDTLRSGLSELEIDLSEESFEKFSIYKELLKKWNKKFNITAITDDVEIDTKHFLDSISPITTELFDGDAKIIDIGTGGGFPGIPLKIYNENLNITLMDSLNKRINFLNMVIEELHFQDIEAIHGRAEELSRTEEYREKYDICISRAVASLNTLSEYCLPFVKVGGYFISMKGPDIEEELQESYNAINTLGGKVKEVKSVQIPSTDIVHTLVIIEKVRNTSDKYPRGGGKPRKDPL